MKSTRGAKMRDRCLEGTKLRAGEIKLKHTKRYIIYKIENKKQIIIEKEGAKEET